MQDAYNSEHNPRMVEQLRAEYTDAFKGVESLRTPKDLVLLLANLFVFWSLKLLDDNEDVVAIARASLDTLETRLDKSPELREPVDKRCELVSYANGAFLVDADETCYICSRHASKKCSVCKIALYCGPECQRTHWKSHKQHCAALYVKKEFGPK